MQDWKGNDINEYSGRIVELVCELKSVGQVGSDIEEKCILLHGLRRYNDLTVEAVIGECFLNEEMVSWLIVCEMRLRKNKMVPECIAFNDSGANISFINCKTISMDEKPLLEEARVEENKGSREN